jgi:hypothetical protein
MIDMTISSSMSVKPDSRFEVRGSRFEVCCASVRAVVIMVPLRRDERFDLV